MEKQRTGKALYVVLALAFAALIAGGATWFYVTGSKDTNTSETSDNGPVTATELQASAKTEVDGSLTELDNELASIELEEESEDDTVDF